MTKFTQTQIQNVWNAAATIVGQDSRLYRMDPYGHTIMFSKYGVQTDMRWEIDHIIPRTLYNDNGLANLQAMQSEENARQKDSLDKKTRYGISARELFSKKLSEFGSLS